MRAYVPEELRHRRGAKPVPYGPAGICRWCAQPIVVPNRKGVTKLDALSDARLRRRGLYFDVERDPDGAVVAKGVEYDRRQWFDTLKAHVDRLDLGPRLKLYRRATWHEECVGKWLMLSHPANAIHRWLEREPNCAECGLLLRGFRERAEKLQRALNLADYRNASLGLPVRFERRLRNRETYPHSVRLPEPLPSGETYSDGTPICDYSVDFPFELVAPTTSSASDPKRCVHEIVRAMGFDPSRNPAEVDHITPLWAGGHHALRNMQVLCQPCHKEKTKRESRHRADALKLSKGIAVPHELFGGV